MSNPAPPVLETRGHSQRGCPKLVDGGNNSDGAMSRSTARPTRPGPSTIYVLPRTPEQCTPEGSNPGHLACKASALPTELEVLEKLRAKDSNLRLVVQSDACCQTTPTRMDLNGLEPFASCLQSRRSPTDELKAHQADYQHARIMCRPGRATRKHDAHDALRTRTGHRTQTTSRWL